MSFLALASYALFVNTGNLIQSQQEDVMKTIDHSLYYTTLYSDISRAHNIEIPNTSQLLLDNDITQDITYTFADTYIVRKYAQRIDTFAIACKLVVPQTQNKDMITIHVFHNNDTIPLRFAIPQTPEILSNQLISKLR
jgi:hypothetical protein